VLAADEVAFDSGVVLSHFLPAQKAEEPSILHFEGVGVGLDALGHLFAVVAGMMTAD
jgi:hypothetical protein